LLGEFYNIGYLRGKDVSNHFYIATLQSWLIHNDDEIYDNVLTHFEELECYDVCSGINKAIKFIRNAVDKRFDEASFIAEDSDTYTYEFEEYKKISRRIYEDVLLEIYEEQIRNFTKGN
tara:strand:- start:654 stop:1010 length:357 start_codon:yes stop_codon:yes gene_type:complete